jgi:hypothetical protein
MSLTRTIAAVTMACLASSWLPVPCLAAPPKAKKVKVEATKGDPPQVVQAREAFVRGTTLVRAAQWAEALDAFERSAELRPHPITTYNIGACERALGRYTVARERLQRALDADPESGMLPESLRSEAKVYLSEIERLLVRVDLVVSPADASITIDGRPLAARDAAGGPVLVAGVQPPGRGSPLPGGRGSLVLDPGTHLITLSRKGFSDQLITRTYKPHTDQQETLNLDRLPARVRVSSNELRARVRIDAFDVGYAPVDVERPTGTYGVLVEKPGFTSYETTIRVNPGEAADIKASLSPTPLTQKWWFWTATGVLVTAAVVGTYYATRSEPTPQRPAIDGGGLGWTVQVP